MSTQPGTINAKKIAVFLILTFILAIVIGSIPALLKLEWQGNTAAIIGVIYMLFPALTAIFVQKVLYHEPVMEPLKVSFKLNKWFAVAWFLPVLLALANSSGNTVSGSLIHPIWRNDGTLPGYNDRGSTG